MVNNQSATLNRQRFEREYVYDNLAVLTTAYDSFIVGLLNLGAAARINARIESQLETFMSDNRLRLFPEAVENYRQSVEQGYPVRPFESQLVYASTYNGKGLWSLYYDRYEYTGGAHGSTVRRSDTYDLASGRVLPLSAFFPRGYDYIKTILENILDQARTNMETDPVYFENYEELILKNFDPSSYYLTPYGMAFYFQQYEIAPYSTGIVVFTVPYEVLGLTDLIIDETPVAEVNAKSAMGSPADADGEEETPEEPATSASTATVTEETADTSDTEPDDSAQYE